MARYRMSGTVRITYYWVVDEEIIGVSESDATDGLIGDLDPATAFECVVDTCSLEVREIVEDDAPEVSETARMRAMGMPTLPGFG